MTATLQVTAKFNKTPNSILFLIENFIHLNEPKIKQ